MSQIPQTFPQG